MTSNRNFRFPKICTSIILLVLVLISPLSLAISANANIYFQKAFFASEDGDNKNAIALYERGLKIAPDSVDGHFYYAKLLDKIGKYRKAIDHYKNVLKISPSSGKASLSHLRIIELKNRIEK